MNWESLLLPVAVLLIGGTSCYLARTTRVPFVFLLLGTILAAIAVFLVLVD